MVTNTNSKLYVSVFIPDAETQIIFNDSIKNSFRLSTYSWFTDRKLVDTGWEFQVDISSAQNINTPKYLIIADQSLARRGAPNDVNEIAFFDHADVRKCFLGSDGKGFLEDSVSAN